MTAKSSQGKISNLSAPNKFFTGRAQEIRDVSHALNKNPILVIQGLSGIGKTQLTKQYAHTFFNQYDLIWWLDGEKNMDAQVDELLRKIFQRINKPYYRPASSQELIKKLKNELSTLRSSWLLIFDNVDDIQAMNQFGPFKSHDRFQKHVIVTHKKMNNMYPALMIDKFQRKDSLAFLSKMLAEEKEEELNHLAEALEDLPLALAQAVSYIKMNPSINIKTFLELLKANRSELWKAEEKLIQDAEMTAYLNDNYNKSMFTVIKMNIASLKEKSSLAYDILCFCSLFHHHRIPLEVLENWACVKRGVSKLEFHEALSFLLNYIVLEKEKKAEKTETSTLFNQHDLIQFVTFDAIDENARKKLLTEAAESIIPPLLTLPETLQEQFKGKEHFYNHMEKICHLAEKMRINDNKINTLKIALMYFVHFMQHDFTRSAQLIKSVSDLPEKDPSLSPLARLWMYSTIVNDQIFEDFNKVQHNYDKALECLDNIQDDETKRSYLLHVNTNYIESLSNFGRLKDAIVLCDSFTDVLKASKNRSQKIAFLGISALVRLKYGQYKQSLNDLDSCLETIKEQKDLENYVPFFMVTKANALLYQGEIEKAYQIAEEYYPHLLEVYASPECMVLVNIQFVRGACLAAFGNLDEALTVVQQSLDAYEKASGFANDALKGMGYRILGEVFEAKGDLTQAYGKYSKAENHYEKMLQEKSLDDLGRLYTRLAILGAKQKDQGMVEKYLSMHAENFGVTHPRTFEIKHYLDSIGLPLP